MVNLAVNARDAIRDETGRIEITTAAASVDIAGIQGRPWVQPGEFVRKGQSLLQLTNSELQFELSAALAELDEARAMELRALQEQTADLQPLRSRIGALVKQVARLREEKRQWTVLALRLMPVSEFGIGLVVVTHSGRQ